MGVFRRHEPSAIEQALRERFGVTLDRVEPRRGDDGLVHEACWFCGREVDFDPEHKTGDTAVVLIEPLGPGEPMHGVCHRDCAERARGSLAP